MLYFMVDKDGKLGHPTRRADMITKHLNRGTAKIISRTKDTLTVQFLNKVFDLSKTVDAEFRIGIDPGVSHIGFSLYKIYKEKITLLLSGELKTRTSEVSKNLSERKMYRQHRRHIRRKNVKRKFGIAKFRKPVWKNRKTHMFQPTHLHLINTHINLIKWFEKRVPINKLHIEYNKFDAHKMLNPKVFSFWYQKGEQYMCNSVKDYVRKRDGYSCRACKDKKFITEVHHIIPRREGGSDRPGNQITLCQKCHKKADNGSITRSVLTKLVKNSSTVNLKQAGVLNSCMKAMFRHFEKYHPTQNTFGYITKTIRQFNNLDKTHEIDAQIIGLSDSVAMQDIEGYEYIDLDNHMYGKQFRRHDRKWASNLKNRNYYICDKNGIFVKNGNRKKVFAQNRRRSTSQNTRSLVELNRELRSKNAFSKVNIIAESGGPTYKKSVKDYPIRKGDLVRYNGNIHCITNYQNYGTVLILDGVSGTVGVKKCELVRRNSGMVLI